MAVLPWVDFASILPTPGELLNRAWEVLQPGGKVGLLHQFHPQLRKSDARLVAIIQVIQGTNARPRCFTVLEKEYIIPKYTFVQLGKSNSSST